MLEFNLSNRLKYIVYHTQVSPIIHIWANRNIYIYLKKSKQCLLNVPCSKMSVNCQLLLVTISIPCGPAWLEIVGDGSGTLLSLSPSEPCTFVFSLAYHLISSVYRAQLFIFHFFRLSLWWEKKIHMLPYIFISVRFRVTSQYFLWQTLNQY